MVNSAMQDLNFSSGYRCLLILGRKGVGKTVLARNVAEELGKEVHVFAPQKEFGDDVKYFEGFRRKDVLVEKERVVVVEDLPRLLGVKRYERTLMELVTRARHLKANVIVISQTDEDLPKKFLKQFEVIAMMNCSLDYKRWWQLLGSKEANFLRKAAQTLPPYRYLLLDVQTGAYVNSLENTDVKKLTKAVKEPIMTDKTLTEAADEDESQKSENENETTTNLIRKTKRERIAELLEKGKTYGEIARAVGTSVGHVKYVAWELKKEHQKSENENDTYLLTVDGGGGDGVCKGDSG
jgi:orotate phosphoribosyltransferase-like protein